MKSTLSANFAATKPVKMDINTKEDIQLIVDKFYIKVFKDDLIGEIFTKVVKLDLNAHLPKMYQFWGSVVLGSQEYNGNPIIKHLAINKNYPLKKMHFDRWLNLFYETIDENFKGDLANKMKNSAYSISVVMQSKIYTESL